MKDQFKGLFRLSAGLTLFFIAIQMLFLAIHAHISGVDSALMNEFNTHLPVFIGFLTPSKFHFIYPLIKFIFLQVLVYFLYASLLWYLTMTFSKMFSFSKVRSRYFLYAIWLVSMICIICGNMYFVPHSYFSILVQESLLASPLTSTSMAVVFYSLLALFAPLTIIALYQSRRAILTGVFVTLTLGLAYHFMPTQSAPVTTAIASTAKPNIIILGFDALRPDYIQYFDKRRAATPNYDRFLQESVVLKDAYTPDARTFPTWLSILTANYPLQHKGRDDNVDFDSLQYSTTLGLELQKQGYETIYASDDNRFNNVNRSSLGFNRLIGPSGDAIDMIVSGMNDLPLTNILMTTRPGKLLFADYIGNHGTPHLYDPKDFIQQFSSALSKRDSSKPVFLAAHFNITAWPFYYLNPSSRSTDMLALYKQAILAGDQQFASILSVLEDQHLLKHTIFVLISDHGITLQLPGDRVVTDQLYTGNKSNKFVKRTPYHNINFSVNSQKVTDNAGESKIVAVSSSEDLTDPNQQRLIINKLRSPFNPERYGIDTSWGYGNDLLSLKQNHAMMAIRFYDLPLAIPHQVAGRVTLMDIAPTVLDLLNYAPMKKVSGISFKPSVIHLNTSPDPSRPLFFESSYTIPEIEQGDINVDKVLLKSMKFYQINRDTALLSIMPAAEALSIKNKQRGIIQGDWMLVFYPTSIRDRFNPNTRQMEHYTLSAYTVLVNLRSGAWTTNLQQPLASTAPVVQLLSKINRFYGDEMNSYLSNGASS